MCVGGAIKTLNCILEFNSLVMFMKNEIFDDHLEIYVSHLENGKNAMAVCQ